MRWLPGCGFFLKKVVKITVDHHIKIFVSKRKLFGTEYLKNVYLPIISNKYTSCNVSNVLQKLTVTRGLNDY